MTAWAAGYLDQLFHLLRYWQRKAAETDLQLSRRDSVFIRVVILEGKDKAEKEALDYLFRGV